MIEITINGIVFEVMVMASVLIAYTLYRLGRYQGKRDAFKAQK